MSNFIRAESLKLKNLKLGSIVVRDDNFRVDGTVTKITKKRFQINNKSNSKKPLNWSILREPPLALRVLDKLEDEYKHVLQQYKDKNTNE